MTTPAEALAAALIHVLTYEMDDDEWMAALDASALLAALDPEWMLVSTNGGTIVKSMAAQKAEIGRLRAALESIVAMERYVTSPSRLDLVVTLGRALDVARAALGQPSGRVVLVQEGTDVAPADAPESLRSAGAPSEGARLG